MPSPAVSSVARSPSSPVFSSVQTEWEALELTDHQWALDDVEEELMARDLHFEGMFKKELQTSIF